MEGCPDSVLSLLHVTVDVFHNNDAVVDEHTQGQNQAKKDDHVERDAEALENPERNQHGKGDGHRHKQGA